MKSIRRQLTLTILLGFGLLLVVSSVAIYFFTRVALMKEYDAGLRAKAMTIMSLTEQGQDGIQLDVPNDFFQEANNGVAPQFYELWQTNGTIIARSESLKNIGLPNRFGSPTAPEYWNLNLPSGHAGRAIGLKFSPKAEDEDAKKLAPVEAVVVVAADCRALYQTLDILATVLALTGLLTIVVTVPVVNFSLRRGHAPLGQLARQAAAITAGSLQTRFPVDSLPEELQPITNRLNDLLGRLEESFERERRFSADLAHELRTPLAELRSLAEVELVWPESADSEKHRETLNIALQMEAMVTRLLELARCESGKISLQLESVLIAPLVKEVWQPLVHQAKTKNKQIAFDILVPPDAVIQTDRALFRSILTNLLANAAEYTPQNGRGEISWNRDAGELTVSNTVEDLNSADLPHLFERLWRKDKSRTGGDHCGLGLALSRAFAELLGFDLKVRLSSENTLTMSLSTQRD
ncbi:MAG TPA: ATP-binding protein [Verrucomicrobiae bacterium]